MQGDRGVEQNRRVEEHKALDEARMPRRNLEREPAAERVPDPDRGLGSHTGHEQLDVLGDAPRRLVRRRSVAEQIRRQHAVPSEPPLHELLGVAPVSCDAVEIDDPRRLRIAPRLDVECPAQASSASSDSGTISVRLPSLTSDQITVPSLSIRKVPRNGAPVASSNTPYARAAAPCCQKSEANA